MFGLGVGEIIVILVIALIFIGPKKLPELAKGLGKGMREFQNAARGLTDTIKNPVDEVKNQVLDQPVQDDNSVAQGQSSPEEEDPNFYHQHGSDEEALAANSQTDSDEQEQTIADQDQQVETQKTSKSEKNS